MHFGHFSLMGFRERGFPTERVMREHAEQVALADRCGFEYAWFAEHHYSNYCASPSPLLMIAHCAALTKTIKLGTAVVVAPLYNPARLLSEIGMTDAIAGGRLVLGVGSGYQPFEFDRFGEDLANAQEQMVELLDMIELAFSDTVFSYQGKHYRFPETNISARPVNGVPEIWIAGDNEFGHRLCATRGYTPMFTGRAGGADYVAGMADKVRAGFKAAGRDPAGVPLGYQRFLAVTSSRQETMAYVENCRHQMRLASALRRRAEVLDGGMMTEVPYPNEISLEQMADNLLVGDCETIAERLCQEIRKARPSHIMFHCQVGGSSQAQALNSIERFASDIRPMVEKELGPLDAIGVPVPLAAE